MRETRFEFRRKRNTSYITVSYIIEVLYVYKQKKVDGCDQQTKNNSPESPDYTKIFQFGMTTISLEVHIINIEAI